MECNKFNLPPLILSVNIIFSQMSHYQYYFNNYHSNSRYLSSSTNVVAASE